MDQVIEKLKQNNSSQESNSHNNLSEGRQSVNDVSEDSEEETDPVVQSNKKHLQTFSFGDNG